MRTGVLSENSDERQCLGEWERKVVRNWLFCDLGDQLPLVGFRIDCGHPEGFAALAKISRMAHGVSLFGLLISLFP